MSTTRGIDFASISLRDALDLAVLIEEEARDRYLELADQLALHHTEEAAGFFRKMARIEELHRAQLARHRQDAFGQAPVRIRREMLFDVEAPAYDEARAFMTERDALMTALASEEKAHAFFAGALPHVQDPEVHSLFVHLREEEVEHQQLVKAELARRAPDAPSDLTDPGDEPVAL